MFKKINKKGQGLMELIVSVGIISLALSSVISLTIFNITTQRISEEEIIASNLAREGIEVTRNLRDSLRLQGTRFVDASFVSSETDHTATAEFTETTNSWTLNFAVNSISNATLYLKNSLYVHDSVSSSQTIYKRLLNVDYICEDSGECGDGICETSDGSSTCTDVIGQRITSTVQWTDKGSTRAYQLIDHLYDWK